MKNHHKECNPSGWTMLALADWQCAAMFSYLCGFFFLCVCVCFVFYMRKMTANHSEIPVLSHSTYYNNLPKLQAIMSSQERWNILGKLSVDGSKDQGAVLGTSVQQCS